MGANTKIEWCHHTWNPWRGCSKVSAGCANCYADAQAKRNPDVLGVWGSNGKRIVAAEDAWKQPLKWDRFAKNCGERHRVFCASMADVFEDWQGPMCDHLGSKGTTGTGVEIKLIHNDSGSGSPWVTSTAGRAVTMQDVRRRLFDLIDSTPNLDWLLLTKRPENVLSMIPKFGFPDAGVPGTLGKYLLTDNVWIGTSVEDQAAADARIPHLLNVPAKVRFLSCEPLLGSVDLSKWIGPKADCEFHTPNPSEQRRSEGVINCERFENSSGQCKPGVCPFGLVGGINWVIVGGESGHHARPMHPDWARSLRNQCVAAGVAFHFKQWGEYQPVTRLYENRDDSLENGDEIIMTRDGIWSERDGQPNDLQSWFMRRVGKKEAGRQLDGREWNELPN